jgi:hypothetical protein
MTCEICGRETPCCRCDYAVLEAAAQLDANHRRWREDTRKEQQEQLAHGRLLQMLAAVMVRIHLVRPELAARWMTEMDDEEIARRLRMYERLGLLTEAELSVAGPKLTAVNVLLPGCDARTDDGRPHGTQPCFPERVAFNGIRQRHARFGKSQPGHKRLERAEKSSGGKAKTGARREAPSATAECGHM